MFTKAKLIALAVAALALADAGASCAGSVTRVGSGKFGSQSRTVAEFKQVDLAGSLDVIVRVGGAQSVVVEGDDNLLELVTTEVKDGRLVISTEESYRSKLDLIVKVTTPALEGVEMSGSGDMTVEGLKADGFFALLSGSGDIAVKGTAADVAIQVTGSGDVSFGELQQARKVSVKIRGSGDVRVKGSTEELEASVTGSGDVNCADLTARAVTIRISGSGDAQVVANGALDVEISGSGDVTYTGDPGKVNVRSTGSGEILKR